MGAETALSTLTNSSLLTPTDYQKSTMTDYLLTATFHNGTIREEIIRTDESENEVFTAFVEKFEGKKNLRDLKIRAVSAEKV